VALHGDSRVVEMHAGVASAVGDLGLGGDDADGDADLVSVGWDHGGDLLDAGVDGLLDQLGVFGARRRHLVAELEDGEAEEVLGEAVMGVSPGFGVCLNIYHAAAYCVSDCN
jgi:hypothetical protein